MVEVTIAASMLLIHLLHQPDQKRGGKSLGDCAISAFVRQASQSTWVSVVAGINLDGINALG